MAMKVWQQLEGQSRPREGLGDWRAFGFKEKQRRLWSSARGWPLVTRGHLLAAARLLAARYVQRWATIIEEIIHDSYTILVWTGSRGERRRIGGRAEVWWMKNVQD